MTHVKGEPESLKRIPGFEWDLAKLSDPATYRSEAKRGYDLKIPSCGRLGMSCPKCYLPIGAVYIPNKKGQPPMCQCADVARCDVRDVLSALGLDNQQVQWSKVSKPI